MIADILKILRQQHNYTLQQVADGINVNASTYKNYEYGRREPDLETTSKIADFYGVTTDFLLGRDPSQTNDLNSMVDSIFNRCGTLPENMRNIVSEFLLKVVEESQKEQDKAKKQRHVERLGDIEDTREQEEQAKGDAETSCA
ncbi:MAG: helix-turn-helix transcriptional regulator [Ruminococcus sp.]|nr:helix-turn-helix transcriptional regulator [Ruminococcus sp.]